jgi:hypothetical protein
MSTSLFLLSSALGESDRRNVFWEPAMWPLITGLGGTVSFNDAQMSGQIRLLGGGAEVILRGKLMSWVLIYKPFGNGSNEGSEAEQGSKNETLNFLRRGKREKRIF